MDPLHPRLQQGRHAILFFLFWQSFLACVQWSGERQSRTMGCGVCPNIQTFFSYSAEIPSVFRVDNASPSA
jgi:hypothetical protein